jgi:hypothetical protein
LTFTKAQNAEYITGKTAKPTIINFQIGKGVWHLKGGKKVDTKKGGTKRVTSKKVTPTEVTPTRKSDTNSNYT